VIRDFSSNSEDGRLLECGEEIFYRRREKKLRTISQRNFSCLMTYLELF